jgi:hypothetical protein
MSIAGLPATLSPVWLPPVAASDVEVHAQLDYGDPPSDALDEEMVRLATCSTDTQSLTEKLVTKLHQNKRATMVS